MVNPAASITVAELLRSLPLYSVTSGWVTQWGESMSEEAEDFFRLHGEMSADMLRDEIFKALAAEDDAKALRLDRLLREIEKLVHAVSLAEQDWKDSLPN